MESVNAIGRRKSSVARVYLTNGSGNVLVNGKKLEEYFPQKYMQLTIVDPFITVAAQNQYDVRVNVNGGGFKGQAEAIRLAVSRALVKVNEEHKKALKDKKYMTRDARVVERKKYGKPKARKSFQFSKR